RLGYGTYTMSPVPRCRSSRSAEMALPRTIRPSAAAARSLPCLATAHSLKVSSSHPPDSTTSTPDVRRSIRRVFHAFGYPAPRAPTPATTTRQDRPSAGLAIDSPLGDDDQVERVGRILGDDEIPFPEAVVRLRFRCAPGGTCRHEPV